MVTAMEQDEEILLELADVDLAYGSEGPEGRGTLQVTSRRVMWKDQTDSSKAFEVEVPCVTLHAISKDQSSFPKPCLYCQVCEDEDDEDETKEVYFVPQDPESLPALFEAMSKAAMMNPDPPEPGEEEGDDELIFDQSGLAQCTEEQARVLEHLESVLTFSSNLDNGAAGQFDDADDEAEGGGHDAAEAAVEEEHGQANGNGHMAEGEGGPHDPAMDEN